MTVETKLTVSADEAPATHRSTFNNYHWRKGKAGFAECNPGHGDKRLVQEWLASDWPNRELDRNPMFAKL